MRNCNNNQRGVVTKTKDPAEKKDASALDVQTVYLR